MVDRRGSGTRTSHGQWKVEGALASRVSTNVPCHSTDDTYSEQSPDAWLPHLAVNSNTGTHSCVISTLICNTSTHMAALAVNSTH